MEASKVQKKSAGAKAQQSQDGPVAGNVQLRGKSYADQQAALSPDAADFAVQTANLSPIQQQGGGVQQNYQIPKGAPLQDSGKHEAAFGVPEGAFKDITVSSQPGLLSSMGASAATQGGNIALQGSQGSSPDLHHELGHAAENLASRGSITAAPAPMKGSNVCAPNTSDEKAADSRADAAKK